MAAAEPTGAAGSLPTCLAAAVADLTVVDPRPGLLRLAGAGTLLLAALWVLLSPPDFPAVLAPLPWATVSVAPLPSATVLVASLSVAVLTVAAVSVAALAWSLLLIATHDAAHGTLLGRPRLETALACLISWPLGWPFLTYARLHHLHHRWNGCDPRDPERMEPTAEERAWAGPLRRWHQRHPLWWQAFGLGGIGLIAATYGHGVRLRRQDPALGRALALDAAGTLLVLAVLLAVAVPAGAVGRVLLGWLLLERLIGALLQTRGLIEHRGLWRRHDGHLLTQLHATRTVTVEPVWSTLLGGLPHHAAHHAFPWIPSHRLPEATERIEAVLRAAGRPPLPRTRGYGAAVAELL